MSFFNKLSNNITNKASSIIGRENLTKLSNAINRGIFSAKYRDFLKAGNVVQIISKNSRMSVQICASKNDANRLIVQGNGQVGPEFRYAHFNLVKDPKNGHLKFQNGMNFFALDEPGGVPCILSEPTHKKPKPHEFIRARNEFRLHEVIGSDEWFSLESVYFPGRYVSITPDGQITVTRDKSDESSHFCLHLIYEHPSNINSKRPTSTQPQAEPVLPNSASYDQSSASAPNAESTSIASSSSDTGLSAKQAESERYAREQREQERLDSAQQPAVTSYSSPQAPQADTTPPTYGNLFPTLPKS